MELPKRIILMNEHFKVQCNYCPVLWMFHTRSLNNKINCLNDRCLRVIANDRSSPPEVLLGKGVLKICCKFTENTHAKAWFQQSCFAALLKSHLGIGVLLQICSIFLQQLFLRIPQGGCFCDDKHLNFEELLVKDNSISIHNNNIHKLALIVYKVANGMFPEIMNDIVKSRNNTHCHPRHALQFLVDPVQSVF